MIHELAILQAARLKGRLSPELAAASAGVDVTEVTADLGAARDAGLVKGEPSVRLTPEGKARLAELVSAERAALDHDALAALYEEFDGHNNELKSVVRDWQLKGDEPNDHTDAAYDADVVNKLVALHEGFDGLVQRIAAVAPRLATYSERFDNAIRQVQSGDHSFIARPIADSYHTVWFEFHEELIGLLGLSREEEAAAGRAV